MLTAFGTNEASKSNYECRWVTSADGLQQFICKEWPKESSGIGRYLVAIGVGVGVGLVALSMRSK